MAKDISSVFDKELSEEVNKFNEELNSEMHFKADLSSDLMSLEWLNELAFGCPYVDNIVRNPKMTLISEENVLKIEKVKKITVESVRNLTRHTEYIEKIDPVTKDVQPSKMLDVRSEETFNTYENRFIYTLIDHIARFMMGKEETLKDLDSKNQKILEYFGKTKTNKEQINIELKITADELPKKDEEQNLEDEIAKIKEKVKKIKDYIGMWNKSEFVKTLDKAHAPFVVSPIKKTNIILKNPNFQFATKLWNYLQTYDAKNEKEGKADGLETDGDDSLKAILNDSFLMDYYVIDSVNSKKRVEKEKLLKYMVIMLDNQVKRCVSILMNNGIDISKEQILGMIENNIKDEKNRRQINSDDVKNKFKSAMDEYLEKTKDYL